MSSDYLSQFMEPADHWRRPLGESKVDAPSCEIALGRQEDGGML